MLSLYAVGRVVKTRLAIWVKPSTVVGPVDANHYFNVSFVDATVHNGK